MSTHAGRRSAAHLPDERVLVLVDESDVRLGCALCGAEGHLQAQPTQGMLDSLQRFVELHATCELAEIVLAG